MRKHRIREHLKFLLRLRQNWEWWTQNSSGFMQGKVRIITGGRTDLLLDSKGLEAHIKRTKKNLERCA